MHRKKMKLKHHTGFKRLGWLITFGAFVITYIVQIVNESRISEEEAFIEFPIISVVIALIAFVFVRATYWVIDGFRKE
jgi:hypothetical protein